MSAAVSWDWWLCRSSDMSQITQLDVHDKNFQPQLDSPGKATGWLHLFDDAAALVEPHQTCLRLDREGESIWSGAIWQSTESSSATSGQQQGSDKLEFTAMGWFNGLGGSSGSNGRLLHTGDEFQTMLSGPNGVAWEAQNGAYVPLGIDTAVELAYDAVENPLTTDAAIIFDLLDRANIDSPTLMTTGNIYGNPLQRNLTLQRFANIGQEIIQLVNVESGVDFVVDPLTRKLDLYGPGVSGSPLIPNGYGHDRGQECLFAYPGNCTSFQRTKDGTRTVNRWEAIGQYSVGRADDIASQQVNTLLEGQASLSEVVDPNILVAYAQAQVAVTSTPWSIITFAPRPIMPSDGDNSGVPRPFEDFNIGDIVYARIDRGATQVGSSNNPQAVRVFGFTVAIDDNGVERLTSLQTTYQGLS